MLVQNEWCDPLQTKGNLPASDVGIPYSTGWWLFTTSPAGPEQRLQDENQCQWKPTTGPFHQDQRFIFPHLSRATSTQNAATQSSTHSPTFFCIFLSVTSASTWNPAARHIFFTLKAYSAPTENSHTPRGAQYISSNTTTMHVGLWYPNEWSRSICKWLDHQTPEHLKKTTSS